MARDLNRTAQVDPVKIHYLGFVRDGPKCGRTILGTVWILYGRKTKENHSEIDSLQYI